MSATVIYGREPYAAASASADGDDLWLSLEDLHGSTGWELKPQGLCLAERCVPIPPGRKSEFLATDGRFNLAVFARYLAQPVVRDNTCEVWLFGEAAQARHDALRSLQAPDFTLPDLDGKPYSLREFRGKKVLLVSWASW